MNKYKEILKIVLAATTESLGKNYSDIMLKFYIVQ